MTMIDTSTNTMNPLCLAIHETRWDEVWGPTCRLALSGRYEAAGVLPNMLCCFAGRSVREPLSGEEAALVSLSSQVEVLCVPAVLRNRSVASGADDSVANVVDVEDVRRGTCNGLAGAKLELL